MARECYSRGLDVQLEIRGLDIGDADGYVEIVFLGLGGRGALSPENCDTCWLVRASRRGDG